MPSDAISPGRMEAFARTLDRADASAIVPRLRIDELRSSFIATDELDRSWKLDPESHRWGCLHDEHWVAEEPPRRLFIDSELRKSLDSLEAMAARSIMKGYVAPYAARICWFRMSSNESHERPASIPSPELATPEPSPRDDVQAFVAEPVQATELVLPAASVPWKPRPVRRRRKKDPAVTLEPVPMLPVTPTRNSIIAPELAPSIASRVAAQATALVEKMAASRPTIIPEAHLRFAGPGFVSVSNDLITPTLGAMTATNAMVAPVSMPTARLVTVRHPETRREREGDREPWVPTSIAPRLMSYHPEERDDRVRILFHGLLAVLFLALASWKVDARGWFAAVLFALLGGALLVLNFVGSRND